MGLNGGIRHIVWDWNGTLFDDQPLVTRSTNASLNAVGFPSLGADCYQDLYRRPLQDFYVAMVGREFTAEEWERVEDAFSKTYSTGMHACGLTADALFALDSWAPYSQSLLSMYDHDKLIPLVDSFGLAARLARIDGRPPELDYGPKTKYLAAHLTQLQTAYPGLVPARVALVGDCVDDAMAALEVGATAVLYTGGSSSRSNLEAAGLGLPVVDSLTEAVELLRDGRALRPSA
ncbi:HAD family hydrolase [Actinospica sp.]|jgi:phosphoglycolate phosphatase-like HAD superfamily hydrolase|uniref:HAD family hydrolase n=1 Tax=Actinospica sp. TaxID=1872142 RepID=UPI002C57FCED|nr:HAD hydrolase-like protein [Actinospica sp.]HWG27996.1 HAD hydrolase-like protein [Actinospica sp.]